MIQILMIAAMFVVCMVLHNPGAGFKFFLFWLAICIAVFLLVDPAVGIWGFLCYFIVIGIGTNEPAPQIPHSVSNREEDSEPDWRIYGNGKWEVKKAWGTGYVDSDGNESWISILGEEHRHNGEIVMENAFIPNRHDIYKNNVCIGYYYKDLFGIIRRVDYQ